ncbi:MAG: hypothetical protein ACKVOD_12095, partial [Flavobacterium sp.]
MKNKFLALAGLLSLFLNSCSSSEEDTVVKVPVVGEISNADVQVSKAYAYGNYTLNGYVKIPAGVTISFEAGTTITADASFGGNDAIVVLKGGKLIMEGTATDPIVCTEKSGLPGSWAGIIMYGDAP